MWVPHASQCLLHLSYLRRYLSPGIRLARPGTRCAAQGRDMMGVDQPRLSFSPSVLLRLVPACSVLCHRRTGCPSALQGFGLNLISELGMGNNHGLPRGSRSAKRQDQRGNFSPYLVLFPVRVLCVCDTEYLEQVYGAHFISELLD